MKQLLYCLCLTLFFLSCVEHNKKTIKVKAVPINGKIVDDIISGPSVLNDPDRFVWGGSVIKDDENRYHMLYSTWEYGASFNVHIPLEMNTK